MTIPSVNNARLNTNLNANLNASMASAQRRGAVFLDRDQTLTIDHGYTHLVNDFAWMPGAPDALALFHRHGIACFIVTNQGGIGRGFYTVAQMQAFNDHLVTQAELAGGHIQDIAHCPHHPKAPTHAMKTPCACRKPAPGMLLGLATKWPIALTESVMIGDRDSDVAAGRAAGCHAYLFDGTDLSALAKQVIDRHFADNLGSDPQRGDHQGGSNRGGSNRGGDHA